MANRNNNPYRTVVLHADRPRVLRLGYKAMKFMQSLSDNALTEMEKNDVNFDMLEQLYYCLLLDDAKEHGEDLTLDKVEDILDSVEDPSEIMGAVKAAIEAAGAGKDETTKNRQAAAPKKKATVPTNR